MMTTHNFDMALRRCLKCGLAEEDAELSPTCPSLTPTVASNVPLEPEYVFAEKISTLPGRRVTKKADVQGRQLEQASKEASE